MEFSCFCKKNPLLKKKRLKSKLCRKDLLNLLNEPQQLTKNKPQKLRKIPNRGVTNLREHKAKWVPECDSIYRKSARNTFTVKLDLIQLQ